MQASKTAPKAEPKRGYNVVTSRPPDRQGPFDLRQIQYRSYQCEIQIYHFRTHLMSVKTFRSKLLHDSHGYVGTLIGTEEPFFDLHIPGRDEIPDGCIEVAYLPSVFPRRGASGCALGFRSGNSLIEWIVFSRPIDSDLSSWTASHMRPNEISVKLDVDRDHPCKLFNLVAFVPKGLEQRRVKGSNPEHKKWHDSLWGAKVRPVAVKLRWKNFGNELKAHHEGMRARIGWENEETHDQQDDDDDEDDGSNYGDNSEEEIFDD